MTETFTTVGGQPAAFRAALRGFLA